MKGNGFEVKATFEIDRGNNILKGRYNPLDISNDALRVIGMMRENLLARRLREGKLFGRDRASVVMKRRRGRWARDQKGGCHYESKSNLELFERSKREKDVK